MARRYTEAERSSALEIYRTRGLSEAAKETGFPAKTISSWAKRRGVTTDAVAITRQATEAIVARAELRRAELSERLIETAADVLERIGAPHIDVRVVGNGGESGQRIEKVKLDLPPASAVRDYAVSIGILIDKYRLERGESTDNHAIAGDITLRNVPDDQLQVGLDRVLTKLHGLPAAG